MTTAVIRRWRCCATIAAPKSAVDPETGRPWTDKNNPDPVQRGRPLIGVPVLYGLVPDGPARWSGQLYNVDNGNSYAGHLLELGPTTIRVEGCAIGIFGGQNMTRINKAPSGRLLPRPRVPRTHGICRDQQLPR